MSTPFGITKRLNRTKYGNFSCLFWRKYGNCDDDSCDGGCDDNDDDVGFDEDEILEVDRSSSSSW